MGHLQYIPRSNFYLIRNFDTKNLCIRSFARLRTKVNILFPDKKFSSLRACIGITTKQIYESTYNYGSIPNTCLECGNCNPPTICFIRVNDFESTLHFRTL